MRYVKVGKDTPKPKRKGFIGVSRESLRALHGDLCYLCTQPMKFLPKDHNDEEYATLEHVIPKSKGGQSTWENVKLAHFKCNNEKQNLDLEDYLKYREESS